MAFKYNLTFCKNIAHSKNGDCLSTEYINVRTPILWSCEKGHQWKASLSNIIQHNSWCPKCCKNRPLSIEDAIKVAQEHNGICLSDIYTPRKNLKWQCNNGHMWEARLESIKNSGTWCPECFQKKITINDAVKIAEEHEGKCLSTEYIPNKKIRWRCAKGHIWEAPLYSVKHNKSWCPECFGNKKLTIEFAKKVAEERKGFCISTEYDPKDKLIWKCEFGHIWEAKIYTIIRPKSTWCPACKKKTEQKEIGRAHV